MEIEGRLQSVIDDHGMIADTRKDTPRRRIFVANTIRGLKMAK